MALDRAADRAFKIVRSLGEDQIAEATARNIVRGDAAQVFERVVDRPMRFPAHVPAYFRILGISGEKLLGVLQSGRPQPKALRFDVRWGFHSCLKNAVWE